MNKAQPTPEKHVANALRALAEAEAQRSVSATAAQHIREWLEQPRYAAYAPLVVDHIVSRQWKVLDDVFWTVIPFGTGGRRGRMYPIGCNAINDRTIGESAQGLADYVRSQVAPPYSCAIAYDTRHRSDDFARWCAEIMVAAGFQVCLLEPYRSTPQLSFSIRHFRCSCGIMVTASHNPPSDNAVKVYWSTGGQLLPPHDQKVIDRVMQVDAIQHRDFEEARREGLIRDVTQESDAAYLACLKAQRMPGPRRAHIVYSPLHGVGSSSVLPALASDGFEQVTEYPRHAQPDGSFPNVPGNVANPENAAVFDEIISFAKNLEANVILATDPDGDRLGAAAPLHSAPASAWQALNGNQIAALLADFVLDKRQQAKTLSPRHYVVKTLVTTELVRRISTGYGVRTIGDLHVGFKWIGGVIDQEGPDTFVFGTEESHGYLVGQYARDKDGAVAAMLMAELTAELVSRGQTLHDQLRTLYERHGYFEERLVNQLMPGSEGMARMRRMMAGVRSQPPRSLGGLAVTRLRDYDTLRTRSADGQEEPLDGPRGDLVVFDLERVGNYAALRPSGTEPKIKYYLFTSIPPDAWGPGGLDAARRDAAARLTAMELDLRSLAESF